MKTPIVFVSSTIQGMQTTRLLVKDLLQNKLGYHVLMSEYEGSKPITPMTQCKKWARECDIFIAIIGEKYGWIIPKLGISVSEMEFNEACKENPEKILVYISAQSKEPKRNEFAQRIADFSHGYYRRTPFKNDNDLLVGIRDDIANFFKERIDFIRSKELKVRPILTPSVNDYASLNLHKRHERMMTDAIELAEHVGFSSVKWIQPYFFLATKNINRIKVLFTLSVVSGSYDRNELRQYNLGQQKYVRYDEVYKQYPNRFALTLVHGTANLRTLDWLTHHFSGTCFKVEPGLFYGEGLSIHKQEPGKLFFENRLILSGVHNKQTMLSKLSDGLEWLGKESKRINFKCNYEKRMK